jgi:hypothetical protein
VPNVLSRNHHCRIRASEQEVFCNAFYIEREIRFAVCECTFYEDRRLATKREMEEIAWFLTTRKSGRSVGFVNAATVPEGAGNGHRDCRLSYGRTEAEGMTTPHSLQTCGRVFVKNKSY